VTRHRPILILIAVIVSLAAACGGDAAPAGPTPVPAPGAATPVTAARVLMVTATAGFRHDSIATAQSVLASLGGSTGEFRVAATEDLSLLTASGLAGYEVVFFALTSGELPLTTDQKAAVLNFVANGGGFLGAHSATDTLYDWPEYGEMLGAYFREHPWTQQAAVVAEDGSHPAMTGVDTRFTINEEFYTFRENPRPRVQVLMRLDPVSVGASGDYPLAWARSYGRGRVYYNALGHFAATWQDARFQRQLRSAIRWLSQS
jgi:type 1 glutamine amidotransferase